MLYHFLFPLRDIWFGFNVFKYITFRAVFAAATAMILSMVLGPLVIRFLYQLKIGQEIRREECPPLYSLHQKKAGTPTMGGVLILLVLAVTLFLWGDLGNKQVWVASLMMFALGGLGLVDDSIKIIKKRSKGLSARAKLVFQILFSLVLGLWLLWDKDLQFGMTELYVPFMKEPLIQDLGYFFLLLVVLVIVGSSNAVNLTDGLDGLAIGSVVITCFVFTVLAYIVGHATFCQYLGIKHINYTGELTVFCAALIGAGLGFLWYNAHPAQVFMGDTGSLALGGALGTVALLIKKEFVLFIVGGIFVLEAVSVILQVFIFKWRGKRIFAMAPLHHHFEMKGWAESKVTIRFWILSIIFALLGLGTLKMM